MNYEKWLQKNTEHLMGKTIILSGATGGLGTELCRYILYLGGKLILINRSERKASELISSLKSDFPNAQIMNITADMEDLTSVKTACIKLKNTKIDIIIHNAGAYSIPRKITPEGYDNVFQINFISPYYITKQLIENLAENRGRVVVVGSIAHNYSKYDSNDIDFKTRKQCNLVYGNSKRFLMFSMYELFKNIKDVTLSVTHPGITFTNITAHYPKLLFAIIKHPMKWIFMKPKEAALSILYGCFNETENPTIIEPKYFGIWGKPQKTRLKTCSDAESKEIFKVSEEIYSRL